MNMVQTDEIMAFIDNLEKEGFIDGWSPTHYLIEHYGFAYREAKDWHVYWRNRAYKAKELDEFMRKEI
jgi:hypothetical protein